MNDLEALLTLWRELDRAGVEYVLATVVMVEGSGYRKPGARMLIAADGRRVGTISGGCLEGDVARQAFWHTERGPVVRKYSTVAEDGEVPFGMGCGGVVHLLLERRDSATPLLKRLCEAFDAREALTLATVLEGSHIGQRAYWPSLDEIHSDPAGSLENSFESGNGLRSGLAAAARLCYEEQRSFTHAVRASEGDVVAVRAEWVGPRHALYVIGAGDDAIPLVKLARQLGWHVVVADGRSHLATSNRFPEADEVRVMPANRPFPLRLTPSDAAAVMTHSLEQDTASLRALLSQQPGYLGVLGPRRRTREMLHTIAAEMNLPEREWGAQVDQWLERLHAPMGLDLGGDAPTDIALAVTAEIQQNLNSATGLALREVRASREGMRDEVEGGANLRKAVVAGY